MWRLERFSSRCSFGDSSKTQIPFGNDKQKGSHTCSPWGMTNKGIYSREEIAIETRMTVLEQKLLLG
jgi:hypothetical protein